jgi:uncharacterized protein
LILVDVNLLLYAHLADSPHHAAARRWLDEQLNAPAPVGLPWHSLLGFLRVVTNRRMTNPPASMSGALAQMTAWLGCDNAWIPQPTERHAEILSRLLVGAKVAGGMVSDAHLAALAIEHGLTLCSADTDFARFSGLRWINPLAA